MYTGAFGLQAAVQDLDAAVRKGAVTQHSRARRVFKDLGVSKRYCSIDSIGDIFVQ